MAPDSAGSATRREGRRGRRGGARARSRAGTSTRAGSRPRGSGRGRAAASSSPSGRSRRRRTAARLRLLGLDRHYDRGVDVVALDPPSGCCRTTTPSPRPRPARHTVHLLASPFVHGPLPSPDGYVREDAYLPGLSRLLDWGGSARGPTRLLKGPGYPPSALLATRRIARARSDVLHVHGAGFPGFDRLWLRGVARDRPMVHDRPRGAAAAHRRPGRRRPSSSPWSTASSSIGGGPRAPRGTRPRPARSSRSGPCLRERERDAAAASDRDHAALLRGHPPTRASTPPSGRRPRSSGAVPEARLVIAGDPLEAGGLCVTSRRASASSTGSTGSSATCRGTASRR